VTGGLQLGLGFKGLSASLTADHLENGSAWIVTSKELEEVNTGPGAGWFAGFGPGSGVTGWPGSGKVYSFGITTPTLGAGIGYSWSLGQPSWTPRW
jgi:hypothetical protein